MKRKLYFQGFSFSMVSLINLITAFGSNIILARILLPMDFGIFFFVISTLGIFYSFLGFNFNLNIIQRKDLAEEYWKTILFLIFAPKSEKVAYIPSHRYLAIMLGVKEKEF
jgi:O-antigen/teichoic acid export membrane protein